MNETKKKTPTTDQLRRRLEKGQSLRSCRAFGNRRRGRWISPDGGGKHKLKEIYQLADEIRDRTSEANRQWHEEPQQ
ncbi:MAG: hypothetical protein HZB28_02540 [Methylocystis sp.]|nr:hypothetical protein [Methylocystis sp.]